MVAFVFHLKFKSFSIRGSTLETHKSKLFSSDKRRFLYLVFSATIDEKPFSQRYDVAKGINIFNASVIKFPYSFRRASQNVFKPSHVNCSCSVLSADIWMSWSWISTGNLVAATTFSLNGFSTHLFKKSFLSSGKYSRQLSF